MSDQTVVPEIMENNLALVNISEQPIGSSDKENIHIYFRLSFRVCEPDDSI